MNRFFYVIGFEKEWLIIGVLLNGEKFLFRIFRLVLIRVPTGYRSFWS